tara:strand:+ start:7034 stop:7759 length:726 start_codon:yes stop_codon:yes gene_type:complete
MKRRLTRYENQMKKMAHLDEVQEGSGVFLYENNTSGTLMLPRKTKSGLREVDAVDKAVEGSGRFQGDNYYMSMVPTALRLIKTIQPADPPKAREILLEEDVEFESIEKVQAGQGYFLYENNTGGTLMLPKVTDSGVRQVEAADPNRPGSGRFQGDDYYMGLVRSNMLRLIKTLRTPQQEETIMENNEKLILDQPDTITEAGKVEHVAADKPVQPLHEGDGEEGPVVLLNENPMDDVEILDN